MSPYFTHLKLPFDLDLRSFAKFQCHPMRLGHAIKDVNTVDARMIEFLAAHNIKIRHAESFYTPPGRYLPVHVDHDKFSDMAKMNFVYGAKGSTMSWWKVKDPACAPTVRITSVGTKYIYIDPKDVELDETAEIGRPTLVNVGRPHSILNQTKTMRWCLSFVMWGSDVQRDLSLTECSERFKEYLL